MTTPIQLDKNLQPDITQFKAFKALLLFGSTQILGWSSFSKNKKKIMIGCLGQGLLECSLEESLKDLDAHCLSVNLGKKSLRDTMSESYEYYIRRQARMNGECLTILHTQGFTIKDRTEYKRPITVISEKSGLPIRISDGLTMEYKLNKKTYIELKEFLSKSGVTRKDLREYYLEINNKFYTSKHSKGKDVDENIIKKIALEASQVISQFCKDFKYKVENTDITQFIKQEVKDNFSTIITSKYRDWQWLKQGNNNNVLPTTRWCGVNTEIGLDGLTEDLTEMVSGRLYETHFGSTGRLEGHIITSMNKTVRKFMFQGNYDFDLEMCNAILIAKKVGANEFLANYKALNGKSVWEHLGITGELKSEFKTAFYTRFFKSYFVGQDRKVFNKRIRPYLYFFADLFYKLDRYYKSLPIKAEMARSGYAGERKNCLNLDFLPSKKEYRYTHKGMIITAMTHSNLKGKYLAHLIQGQEQFIIQQLYCKIDNTFGYAYDGFLVNAKDQEDLMLVEQTAREFLDNNGYPEMNFVIKEI